MYIDVWINKEKKFEDPVKHWRELGEEKINFAFEDHLFPLGFLGFTTNGLKDTAFDLIMMKPLECLNLE